MFLKNIVNFKVFIICGARCGESVKKETIYRCIAICPKLCKIILYRVLLQLASHSKLSKFVTHKLTFKSVSKLHYGRIAYCWFKKLLCCSINKRQFEH